MKTRMSKAGAGAFAVVALLGSLFAGTAVADTNPATAPSELVCAASPGVDLGEVSGAPGAAVGDVVQLSSTLSLSEGQIFQDILTRPDGSTYYASFVQLTYDTTYFSAAGAPAFTLGGVPQTLVGGTVPDTSAFVLDSSSPGLLRVYFPGVLVGAGGTTASLTIDAQLVAVSETDPVAGQLIEAASCESGVATGVSNRASAAEVALIGVMEPSLTVAKTADPTVSAPGGTVTYSLTINNAALTANGVNTAAAYDVHIGGSWNGSTIEWTIPQIASGESLTLTYVMTMPADLDPAAQTVMSNNVAVDATGLPGDVDGERTFSLTDSADVTVGLPGPAISKVSEFDVTPIGQANVNEVSITIPAGGPYFDVLVWDEIPDGVSFDGGLSLSCSSGCTGSDPAPIELSSFTSPAGFTRIGYFLGDVPASTSDRVYVLKYRISIKETDVDGNEPTLGEIFTNVAHVGFNAVDRSGAVTPNLSVPPASDASAVATDDVEYNRPVLNISKVANVASPVDLDPNAAVTYTIEVCNSGGVDANNVMVKDVFAPSGNIGQLWAITSSTSYVSISSSSSPGMFYVSTVPADGCTSFTYEVRFDGSLGSPTSNNEASVVELSDPVGNQYDTSDIAPAVATFAILSPDLVIEKTAVNPIQSTSDTTIDWTISITNNGTGTAYNVTVNDPFPTGVIKQKTTTPNWSVGPGVDRRVRPRHDRQHRRGGVDRRCGKHRYRFQWCPHRLDRLRRRLG